LAIPTLLYGCETWGNREEDKARIMSAEMKFFTTPKYTWQDYMTNEDNLSKINTNPAERTFKITEINGYNIFDEWTETDCRT
jgi:hypothetical protein